MTAHKNRSCTNWWFQTDRWSCPLARGRCKHQTSAGSRCKNKVCIGFPLCWIHNSIKFGVKGRVSTIANAGQGLFATRDFPRNSWVCPYIGENITKDEANTRYGDTTAPYTMQGPKSLTVDAACKRGIASLANCLFRSNGTVASVNRHNCIASHRPVGDGTPGVWLQTTKSIKAGHEIFLYYGNGGYALDNNHKTSRCGQQPQNIT
ncbi:unnamed protein product [Ectocarpus sp. 6 AP-2014]